MQHSNSCATNTCVPHNTGLTWQIAAFIGATVLLLLASSAATYAQAAPTANAAQIEALQKKLDALQSQMAEVQSELRQISGTGAPVHTEAADLKAAIATEQKEEVTQIETELTPKQTELSKVTETYRTFSQDPLAAARINNEPLDPRFPGYFKLPGTATLLRIGGYAKSDFIYDLKPAGNLDSFIPSTIPIPAPATYTNSTISVRPTRLNLDFLFPTKSGDSYRFFLEIDMFGSSSTTPRLRHAYGQAKNFLVGQTFSNFMDPDAGTDQLDFQGPNGWVSIRNPQFRYSLLVANKTTFSISAEKPTSDVEFETPEFSAQPNSPAPDGTLKIRREMDRGHLQLSALFRSVAAFLPDGRHEAVFGWGFNFAGATRLFGKDTIVYQGAYGNGIERYINDTSGLGEDAAVSSLQSPHIQALPVVATYGGLQHFWSQRFRSSIVYSFVQVQNTEAQPGSVYHQGNYTAGNLIWNPFGSLTVGTEFLYGWRVNKDGSSGNAPRIQFSAKYNFIRTQAAE
ncbi:MAG TPA: DcaP family trimeric outer membrane transporter [Candidatus Methylomirabilis sp.]|nr:DcaP family trimeric outer membrane transporter [Candidatus Methylomirabilis sp.]